MTDVLLLAHGSWNPSTTPAYALVPKDGRLLFFTENMKLFMSGDDSRQALLTAEPNQVVEGYKWAQNYTVSAWDSPYGTPTGMTVKTVQGDRPLCTSDVCGQNGWHNPATCTGVFADADMQNATIYFAACRFVDLEEVGSPEYYAETGVNSRQVEIGDVGVSQVDYALANSQADIWLDKLDSFSTEDEAQTWMAEVGSTLSEDQKQMVEQRLAEHFPDWQSANP
ncbi:MAG TPA: hypothetical protein VGN48_07550 [Pedococcus sp.]|jgi:hypothetical protein|nr:hypothetical protein [Pedococcus sp.]